MSLIFPGRCGLPSPNEWLRRHEINEDEALVAVCGNLVEVKWLVAGCPLLSLPNHAKLWLPPAG
jgi:hypothetical protein